MPLFRVTGIDSRSGEARSIVIEANRMLHALSEGGRRGLHSVNAEEITHEALADDESIVRPGSRSVAHDSTVVSAADSPLLTRPVMTIAKGVFLGLLFWALFVMVVYGVIAAFVGLVMVAANA
jgi:hypothetical protein